MLTIDPSQKKLVWALLAILLAAICVTVIRIRPAQPVAAVVATEEASEPSSRKPGVNVQVANLSRNPFRAPELFARTQERSNAAELGLPIPGEKPKPKPSGSQMGKLPPIQPLAVRMPNDTNSTNLQSKPGVKEPPPVFALLATIRSAGGLSAVIKSNDSVVRVVNVGDRLEGGYKVRALQPGRAVLSNGEDTIVASKPQS